MKRTFSIPLVAAAVTFLAHLVANPHYGFFRDELYFIICGRHPQFGYVDQPPVVPLLSALTQSFGPSLVALRALAALGAAATVYVTCLFVIELGGKRFAQVLAAIAAALSPVVMGMGVTVQPDTVQVWAWPLLAYLVLRLVRGADPRLWLAVGATFGIAIESKYSVIFWAVAVLAGLALTKERRILATPWALAGAGVAIVLTLPNFLWQAVHGFPMWELLRNGAQGKNVVLGPASYVLQEVLVTNPVLAIVWLCGLVWTFFTSQLRWLGIAFVVVIAMMIGLHGKDYYAVGAYPALFAAGAVALELWTARARLLRPVALAVAALAGAIFVPLVAPVLSEPRTIAYTHAVVVVKPKPSEHHRPALMSQEYADMHGWESLAADVAAVYRTLTPDEQRRVAIVGSNYGEAAAVDFFGTPYGLPPAISGHNQYFLWGTHGRDGSVVIDINGDCGKDRRLFASTVRARVHSEKYAMPYESGIPIMVCRGLRMPLATLWPQLKDYI